MMDLKITKTMLSGLFLLAISSTQSLMGSGKYSDRIDSEAVRRVVNDAIEWQRNNMPTHGRAMWNIRYAGWADGTFLSAVSDWANYDNSRDFKSWYRQIGEERYWEPGPRSLNPANDIAVSIMYANCWLDDPQERYTVKWVNKWDHEIVTGLYGGWSPLIPTIERLDYQMKYCPVTNDLEFEVPQSHERWCWCDALYVGAPVFALYANLTGNAAYRDFMDREFWFTYDALYDKDHRLFYRDTRFIPMREKNGQPVFWGRGNGWVVAALARILNYLPAHYPTRSRYVTLFQEMMQRVASLQDENGFWHTSLLDYDTYTSPETSSTGFFTYALWWGINRGLLPQKEYLSVAEKAWKAMVSAVHDDGKLGYVQSIGDAPQNITKDKNEVYGTAAFALAGLEVARYADTRK